jgi:fatty-acyl-CoA synthase/long-chain acyl-CoA synthetase
LAFQRTNRRRLLGEALGRSAINFPDKVALHDIETGKTLTYPEFEERANRLAHGLIKRGLSAGDRLCVLGRNYIDTLVVYYAGAKIGAITVPLNYYAITEEQRYIIQDCAPKMVVVSTECLDAVDRSLFDGIVVLTMTPDGESGDIATLIAEGAVTTPDLDVPDRGPAFILYTGGTTGRPKGVVLSQANYVSMAQDTIQVLAPQTVTRDDSWLILGPLYHGAALAYSIIGLQYGQTVHLMREYNATVALDAIAKGYGTITWFIPTVSRKTVDHVADKKIPLEKLEGLRLIISAGAPLSIELRQELKHTFRNCEVIDIVGQTEMTSTIIAHAEPKNIARSPTAVGLPAPSVVVALVDENNQPVATGEVGELCYLGETLMLGYWNKPDITEQAMSGGWFHSGDLARRDETGLIFIAGRKKELIKSGGENVIPNEVEDVLRGVPGIADVCVLGLPDKLWGERIHAVLAIGIADVEPEALRAAAEQECRARLSRFKVPKTWTVLAALPANAIGKTDKAKLRTIVGDGTMALDLRGAPVP